MPSDAAYQRAEQGEMPLGRLLLVSLPIIVLVAAAFWYALAKLQRLGLAVCLPGGRWRAVDIRQALVALDTAWDGYFHHRHPEMP